MKKLVLSSLLLGLIYLTHMPVHAGNLFDFSKKEQWVGQPVPAFKLEDQYHKWQRPEQYRGKWLVLYFYPKDGTDPSQIIRRRFPLKL